MKGLCKYAPVLSKYHSQWGFERERFIADYERWTIDRREALRIGGHIVTHGQTYVDGWNGAIDRVLSVLDGSPAGPRAEQEDRNG